MPRLVSIAMLTTLCACALPALASESLKSYNEVTAALDAGYDVSVSTDLARCAPEEGTPVTQTRGGRPIA
ncbi:VirK family protein, partial [Xanthomonas vasicola]|uniref:VirK family protein n=1 Tax=Xanthomonas vasicola TaxID=56459 RepID=UPI001D06DF04